MNYSLTIKEKERLTPLVQAIQQMQEKLEMAKDTYKLVLLTILERAGADTENKQWELNLQEGMIYEVMNGVEHKN